MSGENIVEIVGIIVTGIVAVVSWLVRARVIELEGKVQSLTMHIQSIAETKETLFPRQEKTERHTFK